MAKRVMAKVGTYQKDGQEKGEYAKLGVVLSNDKGEYMLLDPAISLAGVLAKQNAMAAKTGGQQRDMVMVSMFEDQPQQQAAPQQQYQQQPPQQQQYQQQVPQQQGGYAPNEPPF